MLPSYADGLLTRWGLSDFSTQTSPILCDTLPLPVRSRSVAITAPTSTQITLAGSPPQIESLLVGSWILFLESTWSDVRKIETYTTAGVCDWTDPLPAPPSSGRVVLCWHEGDEALSDWNFSLHPSSARRLDPTATQVVALDTQPSYHWLTRETQPGNPLCAHDGTSPDTGTASTIYIDTSASIAASLLTTRHSFRGCLVEQLSGDGIGQVRRIVGYDESTSVAEVYPVWDVQPVAGTLYKVYTELENTLEVLDGVSSGTNNGVEAHTTGITIINDGTANKNGMLVYKPSWAQVDHSLRDGFVLSCTVRVDGTMASGKTGIAFGMRVPGTTGSMSFRVEIEHDGGGGAGDLICSFKHGTTQFHSVVLEAGADPTTLTEIAYKFHFYFSKASDRIIFSIDSLTSTTHTQIAAPTVFSGISAMFVAGSPLSATVHGGYCFFGCSALSAVTTAQFLQFHAGPAASTVIQSGDVSNAVASQYSVGDAVPEYKGNHLRGWNSAWPYEAEAGWDATVGAWSFDKTSNASVAWYRVVPSFGYYIDRGFVIEWEMDLKFSALDGDQTGFTVAAFLNDPSNNQYMMRLAFLADVGDPQLGFYVSGPVQDADSYFTVRLDWSKRAKYVWVYVPEEDFTGIFYNGELVLAVRGSVDLGTIQNTPTVACEPMVFLGMDQSNARATARVWHVGVDTEVRHFAPERYNVPTSTLTTPSSTNPNWIEEIGTGSSSKIETEPASYTTEDRVYWRATSSQTPAFAWRKVDSGSSTGHRDWIENRTLVASVDLRVPFEPKNTNVRDSYYWTGSGITVSRQDGRLFLALVELDNHGKGILVCSVADGTTLSQQVHKYVEGFNRNPDVSMTRFFPVDWSSWVRVLVRVPGGATESGRIGVQVSGHPVRILDDEWMLNSYDFGGTGWASGDPWLGFGVFSDGMESVLDVKYAWYGIADGKEVTLALPWTDEEFSKHSIEDNLSGAWLSVYSEEL